MEVVNGRIKRDSKLLRQGYFNTTLRNLFPDFRIASALINAFQVPIVDNVNAAEILNNISQRMHMPNHLFEYVNDRQLNRQRIAFVRLDANDPQLQEFPHLTETDIAMLALGSYQLKLAKSYCAEHINNGLYFIEVYRDNYLADIDIYNMPTNVWLLRIKIQSRHVRARTYYCYILVDRGQEGIGKICHYYCSCLSGRRTIGTCAHVLSVVWYLGYGRHRPFSPPAGNLIDVIIDE